MAAMMKLYYNRLPTSFFYTIFGHFQLEKKCSVEVKWKQL